MLNFISFTQFKLFPSHNSQTHALSNNNKHHYFSFFPLVLVLLSHHNMSAPENHDAPSSKPTLHKVDDDKMDESSHVNTWKRQNLHLEIPWRTSEEESCHDFVGIRMPLTPSPTPTHKRVNFLATSRSVDAPINNSYHASSTSRAKSSSMRNILPKLGFRNRTSSLDIEKAVVTVAPEGSSLGPQEKSSISRSVSLTKMFTTKIKRTSSLPVEEIGRANTESVLAGCVAASPFRSETQGMIARSRSVPVNSKEKSIRRMDAFFRIIPSTPRVKEVNETTKDSENGDGEDIAEEEAVCRICMVDLCEGGETFKLECSCKGELALAHQECAVKWFSIKGNKTCDVCKEEVRNLPVTLLRIRSVHTQSNGTRSQQEHEFRVWQELPVLVIVSMLAYFCFLEQLLVGKMKTKAIFIALPFSCVLGLLSSVTSATMVKNRFTWIYAAIQFALVVIFAHIFYTLVGKHAVLSILLATFAGFGVVMSGSSILIELSAIRRRWQVLSGQQHGSQMMSHEGQYPQVINSLSSGISNHGPTAVQNQQNSNQS
ncbi:hypothetical protein RJT34_28558 [Clitoria ternatea]|uniref:RING-CH-type domain-containing protein n=1 Tax=Clitoria ternatea TaxID=43366 RepID=A0AAN9FBB2_CLITE